METLGIQLLLRAGSTQSIRLLYARTWPMKSVRLKGPGCRIQRVDLSTGPLKGSVRVPVKGSTRPKSNLGIKRVHFLGGVSV